DFVKNLKKGRPVGLPLRTSSVLDACGVGSPHTVFWTACSSGVMSGLSGYQAPVGAATAAGLLGRAALDCLSEQ
ncbi:hypothetical protein, partial [Pseudomonas corrugata]|uniref:hypothetical protein n=1 Tax=Pseudomonas corrugata TaxID=47879 RepID=UPI0019D6CDCB